MLGGENRSLNTPAVARAMNSAMTIPNIQYRAPSFAFCAATAAVSLSTFAFEAATAPVRSLTAVVRLSILTF